MALLLVVVQLDVIVDWTALGEGLRALAPGPAAVAWAVLACAGALDSRRFVAAELLGPRLDLVRRQPVSASAAGVPTALLLLILGAPVAAVAAVWYGPSDTIAMALWTLLGTGPALLLGAGRPLAAILVVGLAMSVVAIGQAWPAARLPALAAAVVGMLPLLGAGAMRLAPGGGTRAQRVGGRSTGVLTALVRRDVLALVRREPGTLAALGVVALLVGLVVRVARVNNAVHGMASVCAALLALAAVGPFVLAGAGAAARHAGRRFDPPEWPVLGRTRALALAATASVLLLPSWAAAAVGGAGALGPVAHLRVAALFAAMVTGAACLVAVRPRRPDHGVYPWWLGACLALTMAGSAWGPLAAAGLAGAALWGARAAIVRRRR